MKATANYCFVDSPCLKGYWSKPRIAIWRIGWDNQVVLQGFELVFEV
jgi:hypothetical protein